MNRSHKPTFLWKKKSPIFLKANWTLHVFHLFDMINIANIKFSKT